VPLGEASKKGTPYEIVILQLLIRLAWERLQIDTDLLLIITITADELFAGNNIDDLEQPWTQKYGMLVNFFGDFRLDTFQEQIAPKSSEIHQENMHSNFQH